MKKKFYLTALLDLEEKYKNTILLTQKYMRRNWEPSFSEIFRVFEGYWSFAVVSTSHDEIELDETAWKYEQLPALNVARAFNNNQSKRSMCTKLSVLIPDRESNTRDKPSVLCPHASNFAIRPP